MDREGEEIARLRDEVSALKDALRRSQSFAEPRQALRERIFVALLGSMMGPCSPDDFGKVLSWADACVSTLRGSE